MQKARKRADAELNRELTLFRQGTRPVISGLLVGMAGALPSGRQIRTLLFWAEARDPTAILAVIAILLAVAALACWVQREGCRGSILQLLSVLSRTRRRLAARTSGRTRLAKWPAIRVHGLVEMKERFLDCARITRHSSTDFGQDRFAVGRTVNRHAKAALEETTHGTEDDLATARPGSSEIRRSQ